jgi:hypothetical protein
VPTSGEDRLLEVALAVLLELEGSDALGGTVEGREVPVATVMAGWRTASGVEGSRKRQRGERDP